jgi:sigma-E factor negative regulatory protein RseC
MREEGIVVAVNGNIAKVAVESGEHCSHCNLCAAGSEGQRLIEAENTASASPKDRVSIEVRPGQIVKTSLIIYVVPLLALIGGVIVGNMLADLTATDEDLLGIICGFAALGIALLGVKSYDRHIAATSPPPAKVITILGRVGGD